VQPLVSFAVAVLCLSAATLTRASDGRADFLKLIERPRVQLAPELVAGVTTNGLTQIRFSFATEKDQRVPGVLLKREDSRGGRRPVVIALHGTGSSKANMLSLCRKLATNGFVAVAIDARYHGDRITSGKGTEEYNAAIARAWREGREHPFYYDTVWDVMRLVDYLQTRQDVDAKRIGLVGISKGGIETYLAAAVDERIAVAVPIIGVQSFRWGLENDRWQARIKTIQDAFNEAATEAGAPTTNREFVQQFYNRIVPGIYGQFDGPAMLPLIAPRPLLVINGDSDPHTPLAGVREAAAAAQQAYQQTGVPDRFQLRIQENTGHQVRPESERAAIDWLVKWLKP
jgi:dienelactone hydrolase